MWWLPALSYPTQSYSALCYTVHYISVRVLLPLLLKEGSFLVAFAHPATQLKNSQRRWVLNAERTQRPPFGAPIHRAPSSAHVRSRVWAAAAPPDAQAPVGRCLPQTQSQARCNSVASSAPRSCLGLATPKQLWSGSTTHLPPRAALGLSQ